MASVAKTSGSMTICFPPGGLLVPASPARAKSPAIFTRVNVRILLAVFVAMFAMSPCKFSLGGSSDAIPAGARASLNIDPLRNGFDVMRINARPHAAQMVTDEATWHRSVHVLVQEAVNQTRNCASPITRVNPYPRVSVVIQSANPQPTAAIGFGNAQIQDPVEKFALCPYACHMDSIQQLRNSEAPCFKA